MGKKVFEVVYIDRFLNEIDTNTWIQNTVRISNTFPDLFWIHQFSFMQIVDPVAQPLNAGCYDVVFVPPVQLSHVMTSACPGNGTEISPEPWQLPPSTCA